LNVHRIRRINRDLVERDEDSAPESISDTKDWLNCNGNFDKLNDTEDHCDADVESHIDLGDTIGDLECLEQQDMSAVLNVPGLI